MLKTVNLILTAGKGVGSASGASSKQQVFFFLQQQIEMIRTNIIRINPTAAAIMMKLKFPIGSQSLSNIESQPVALVVSVFIGVVVFAVISEVEVVVGVVVVVGGQRSSVPVILVQLYPVSIELAELFQLQHITLCPKRHVEFSGRSKFNKLEFEIVHSELSQLQLKVSIYADVVVD